MKKFVILLAAVLTCMVACTKKEAKQPAVGFYRAEVVAPNDPVVTLLDYPDFATAVAKEKLKADTLDNEIRAQIAELKLHKVGKEAKEQADVEDAIKVLTNRLNRQTVIIAINLNGNSPDVVVDLCKEFGPFSPDMNKELQAKGCRTDTGQVVHEEVMKPVEDPEMGTIEP